MFDQRILKFCCLLACALGVLIAEDLEMRLEPPPPLPGTESVWDVGKVENWRNQAGAPPVELALYQNGLRMQWNGNADWSSSRPRYGIVESVVAMPFVPQAGARIRVTLDLLIDKLEADSCLMPVLQFFGEAEKFLFETDIYPPDYQLYVDNRTASARPRRYDRTISIPNGARSMRVAFHFCGNAISATLVRAAMAPAVPLPNWDTKREGWVRAKRPDRRYGLDDANPRPDVPLLSEAEVTALLEQRPWAKPEVSRRNDRMVLTINGQEQPFTIAWPPFNKSWAYLQDNARMGYKLFLLPVALGPSADSEGWPCNVWLDEDKYDFQPIAKGIRHLLRLVPDAHIVLYLRMTLPTAWAEKHPDAIFTNPKGERGISEWSRVNYYAKKGQKPRPPREFYEACNTSLEFREGGRRALEALGRYLNAAPEGKVVIGAYIHGGADTQWFFSSEQFFEDRSPGSLKAFRQFLKEKYGTDKALSQAWGRKEKLRKAQIPDWNERHRQAGPDPNLPRSALMSYNSTEQWAADYNEYLSVYNARRQVAFSQGLKNGSNGRLLVGTYWPTLPASYPLQHNDFYDLLKAPAIDFISRGGLLGANLHGKFAIAEFDWRNARSGLDGWLDYDHPFIAKSQAEFRRYVLAATAAELTAGGYHLWDMHGGWHFHPTTQEILREAQGLTRALKDVPSLGEDYIGVFVDEKAADQLANLGAQFNVAAVQTTAEKMGWNFGSAWEKVGVSVRFFLLQDALNEKLTLPKVAIFLNPLTMTLEQGEAIRRRFENQRRVVVYMTSPGLAAPGTLDNPSKITGFRIRPDVYETANRVLQISAVEDPILAGMRPGSFLGLFHAGCGMEWITSPVGKADEAAGVKVLANYAGTNLPGMLVKRSPDCTRLWIGCPGAVNVPLLRNLAREARLPLFLENDSRLMYGAGLLAVAASPSGGEQLVRLPSGVQVLECLTGQKYAVQDQVLRFTLGTAEVFGDVAVFSVGPAEDAGKP